MLNYRNNRTAESVAKFWGKSLDDKEWYAIKNEGESAEIRIYDVIGWPFIDADTFVNELNRINAKEITVSINSPGGDVFDGTAIFNALNNHPAKIITRIDGIAASMASIIALSGDEIQINSNAYYMIHNAWSFAIGDYNDMRKEADLLEKITNTLATIYAEKTGIDLSEVRSMMDDETWLIGDELVDQGFADTVISNSSAKASFNLDMYDHAPKEISGGRKKSPPKNIRDLERGLRDLGYSRAEAVKKAGILMQSQSDSGDSSQSDSDLIVVFNQTLESVQSLNG